MQVRHGCCCGESPEQRRLPEAQRQSTQHLRTQARRTNSIGRMQQQTQVTAHAITWQQYAVPIQLVYRMAIHCYIDRIV